MNEKIRIEAVISKEENETQSDAAIRAKCILLGMDKKEFDEVEIRKWRKYE